MNQWRFIIDDISNAGLSDILARTRRSIARYGIKLVVVDYLQLLKLPKAESRRDALDKAGVFLKNMAKALKIHVLAIAKLNRDCVKPSPHRPTIDDLGDCDSLAYHADNVFIIWRPEYYGIDFMDNKKTVSSQNCAELVIGKQRQGPTSSLFLTFRKQYSRFENYSGRIQCI